MNLLKTHLLTTFLPIYVCISVSLLLFSGRRMLCNAIQEEANLCPNSSLSNRLIHELELVF